MVIWICHKIKWQVMCAPLNTIHVLLKSREGLNVASAFCTRWTLLWRGEETEERHAHTIRATIVGGGSGTVCLWRIQPLLPDGYSHIFRSYVFGHSGFWTVAPLCYAAKFDPFLSLDCAPRPPPSKERKGSNFAIWQHWSEN